MKFVVTLLGRFFTNTLPLGWFNARRFVDDRTSLSHEELAGRLCGIACIPKGKYKHFLPLNPLFHHPQSAHPRLAAESPRRPDHELSPGTKNGHRRHAEAVANDILTHNIINATGSVTTFLWDKCFGKG